ncbi:Eukaryotic translation initiation factor 2-alpha kinase [Physocladia obscura]|uniref:non-specific serine/threonine protein kinase n=1 Tax=Physocladia obscura TaxID=109957 RepID=A0AAD5T9C0_9FUNG|nr:Eukaryotic translation initiation factor 2-alpha kinase [Physocladia obscura]
MKSSHPPPNADNTAKHLSTSSLLSPNAVPAMRVNPIPTPSPGVSRKKSFDSFAFLPTQSDQQHPHVGSLQPQHSRRAQQIPSPSPKSMAASLKSNLSMPSNQSQSSYTKSKNTTATATFDTKLTPLFDEHREFPKDSSYLEKLERITSAIRPEIEAYKSLKQVVDARDIPELRTNNIDGKSNIVNVGFEEGSEESEQEVSGSCSSSAEITSNESNESSIFSESADDSRSEAGSESESDSVAFTNSSSESSESEDSNSPSSCFAKRQQHINLNVKKTTVHSSATTAEIGTLSETYHMASMDIVRSSAVSLSTLLQKNVSIEDISDADSQPHHHQRYHHHQHHHREHAHGKHNLLVREKKLKQGRLLLVSLLENFCMLYDQSPERNKRLFFVLCKQLSAMGIIDSEDFLDEISAVRGAYKRAFKELVMQAMQAIREENATRLISSHANDETGSQSSIGAESDEHEK